VAVVPSTLIDLPDELADGDGLVLRPWRPEDAQALSDAIAENIEHLRPFMAWIAEEPISPTRRRQRILEWERDFDHGGDAVLAVFLDGRLAGSSGLHRRLGPDGLEIGYWIHRSYTRRGLATRVARLLTDAALALPGITRVEIHHDEANQASAGVPRKLGFELVETVERQPVAPAEIGVEWRWRMDATKWQGTPEA
jgi:RimJ/RimL family protein N-acetyltransferase